MAERNSDVKHFVAFAGQAMIGKGQLAEVARAAKAHYDLSRNARIAIFDDESGYRIDLDLSGSEAEVVTRAIEHPALSWQQNGPAPAPGPRGPGRPRLGVVSREVSLLPRHWSWLANQRGGASAAIRRLIDQARRADQGGEQLRQAVDATHRFLWDMAGDLPGFEEATRSLFAHDFDQMSDHMAAWPVAIRQQAMHYLERATG